ncbi:MAG: DUF1684 domain-containing protein [Chloroflexi bacterium]|nr:DUF1684 domain-containing protein [Chloroflexota bacterium]
MTSYTEEITRWRERQDASLRAEDGWLTLAGLFWLTEGAQRAGADPSCDIVLPAGAPPVLGGFERTGHEVLFRPVGNALINGEPAGERVLRSDTPGPPDLLTFGSFTLLVIERGERVGLRLRDRDHPARRAFAGRRWFPVDERYCINARFVPYQPPRAVAIPTILGDLEEQFSPGAAVFAIDDREYRLDATQTRDGGLFFVFRDATCGKEAYGAGRFLYASAPRNGAVTLDFNQAVNPPCVFTAYATCPLPPRQNILPVRIEAGEQVASQTSSTHS